MAAHTETIRAGDGTFDRVRQEYETTNETKSGFRTSEFLSSIIASLGVLIAALVQDEFNAQEAWTLVAALSIGYMLSRGIAKAGVGRHGR